MQLHEEKTARHLKLLIAFSFFASVVSSLIGLCFPPDLTTDPPKISETGLLMGHLQTAMLILGCTAQGIKLTEEKKMISSIGFTMMAIAQGVVFVLYVVSPQPTKENLDEIYKLYTASLFLLIPSMLLIVFYGGYPKWLNILGIAALVPWILENILYSKANRLTDAIGATDFAGQLLMNATTTCWGVYALKDTQQPANQHKKH